MSNPKEPKWTQREWDRVVGYGSPPSEDSLTSLPEYELDKSTGEVIKKYDDKVSSYGH